MTNRSHAPVIWRLTDGKAGHDSQSSGLCLALQENHSCIITDIECPALAELVTGNWLKRTGLTRPDMVIGAGHKTHIPMLLTARRYHCASVVIMRPSVPMNWFDLCLVPEHDAVKPAKNVIITRGAISPVKPSTSLSPDEGLILVGGPSKRHGWDQPRLLKMIAAIAKDNPKIHWTITDSPRTPADTVSALSGFNHGHVEHISYLDSSRAWLLERLAICATRWVSEDSVSMIYEALTAAGNSHILTVPRTREDKVTRSLDKLYGEGCILRFESWQQGLCNINNIKLHESARCAEQVFVRLLNNKGTSSL